MQKEINTANQNKKQAAGKCPVCERKGIPVFLLRQAVIKLAPFEGAKSDFDYQSLANYAQKINFKNRMPDEQLKDYGYILRTLRNGYVYVMQQKGDDINTRILEAYECIDGALRLKDAYSLSGTEPRPLSKACYNACHSIPASFINLDDRIYTNAWVAYVSQPWSSETINQYIKEQDKLALSRFTHIDITKLKDDPDQATNNRAVPFADIFGKADDTESVSNVLEFRIKKAPLPNFRSAHPFVSLYNQKRFFAYHVNRLSDSSCGVVVEDTFGIAEELNSQRLSHLHIFNEKPLTDDELKLAEESIDNLDDIDKETKIYEQRAKNMLKTINPYLQQRFKYYEAGMLKKRMIFELMTQYRQSIVTSYDREIAKVEEEIEKVVNSGNDNVGYNGIPVSAGMRARIGRLSSDKKQALDDFDDCVNQDTIQNFTSELESAYNEVVNYCREWSQDYYTYVRWLFGKQEFISDYGQSKPSSFNLVHFWQREFDFSVETALMAHVTEVTQILLDSTHSEIKFANDSALWDELLSNPESIYYIIDYNNPKGIDRDEEVYVELTDNRLLKPSDIISNVLSFAPVVNKVIEEVNKDALKRKQYILEQNKAQLEAEIKINQQKIEQLESKKKSIPLHNQTEIQELIKAKRKYNAEIQTLNKELEKVNQQMSEMAQSNVSYLGQRANKNDLLNNTALKKQAVLIKDQLHIPIKSQWMRLNAFDQLARIGAMPVEINIQIKPENIAKIQNLFTQMQRGFFNRGLYHPLEQEFLQNFDIDEEVTKTGTTKTRKAKFTLCFPDKVTRSLFVEFIKKTNGILNPYELKKFIENAYKDYFKLIYKQKNLQAQLENATKNKTSINEKINQGSSKNTSNKTIKINQKIEKIGDLSNKNKIDLETVINKIELEGVNSEIKIGKITFAINLAVDAISCVVTLMNIKDTLKEWGVAKEGSGEQKVKVQLIKDVVSLTLTSVDLTSQYQNIKLNKQLENAINTNKQAIRSQLKLNTLINKTVSRVTTVITVLEAIGELKSSFDMVDMENKGYFVSRLVGSIFIILGSVILLASTLLAAIIGIAFIIGGGIATLFSKKYDKYTPIQHWLNRCYFGKQAELKFFDYDAYHEEDRYSHSGFGLALNDYTVMIYGIQTFIRKKPLYNGAPVVSIGDSANMLQQHIYFYVDIPDFAKANPNEVLTASIRLYLYNWEHLDNQSSVITDKYIDLKCRVTTNGIEVLEIKNGPGTDKYICTDKKMFFNKYELPSLISKFPSSTGERYIDEPAEFQLMQTLANGTKVIESKPKFSDIKNVMVKQDDSIDSDGLIINKWVAGTIGANSIKKYHIIIEYNNREAVPLIITKKSSKIN
ncbi:toxin VasX [Gilliamella apicola]|uniref:toxin VasX n=2 Tax=Gilliamella apicola TaxID=1196095 RepID=UPI002FEE20D4